MLDGVTTELKATTKAFEDMQKVLLLFCGIAGLGLLIAAIAIFKK